MRTPIDAAVKPASARADVRASLPDGRVLSAPQGVTVESMIRASALPGEIPTVAALVDGELAELTTSLRRDAALQPVTMASADGMRVYRRSLSFMLITAARELFSDVAVFIDHSVSNGGYFCHVTGRNPFSKNELGIIKTRMREIVSADEPITRREVSLPEAIKIFEKNHDDDKVRLLRYREKPSLVIYSLREMRDYFHGYMVPSTGYLPYFDLTAAGDGFILWYPRRRDPTRLHPPAAPSPLFAAFQEYGGWLRMLGVHNVGGLNEAIENERIHELSLVAEALHEQHIARISTEIAALHPRPRLVLIAGPSSAGKTTFSKRLTVQLLAHGIRPFHMGVDDFFVDREKTPLDENGDLDFESPNAIDIHRLNRDLRALAGGEEVALPRYNFMTGKSEPGPTLRLGAGHVILLEGIHCLNPDLITRVPDESVYRIFVSALTQLNLDRHNRASTTDTRLIRRLVRDAHQRGWSPRETIQRWESVRRGEKRHIIPYQQNADTMFNSALAHELAVLRPLAEPLLLQVQPRTSARVEVKRLLALLQWFRPCPADVVPGNSILREFIGGSALKDFSAWDLRHAGTHGE
ncbi:MAG: nucleoside kinase [Anaerolineales bacterium]|nr:nucleoside kinase [Anaerolineales bacterium]MDP7644539.1 nucleoside kinase [Anaerolineales bacterium]HJN42116.1 nucleoside kinase [Anaerolineales bacterium]